MVTTYQNVSFVSGDLTLEGIVHWPQGTARHPGVVLCHPHPRYGGTMHNSVVAALASALCDAGLAAFRFNFRGVGNSEGGYDRGIGEVEDAANAVSYLTLDDRINPSRVGIAGYSFGAGVALEAIAQSSVLQAVASIACPMATFREVGVREMVQPKLLVCGDLDHNFPADQFKFLARRFPEPKDVTLVDGADHFFAGRESEIALTAAAFFKRWLGDRPGRPQ